MGLQLDRRVGESVRVGNALITLISTRKGAAKLEIDAPPEVEIRRSEIDDGQPMKRKPKEKTS